MDCAPAAPAVRDQLDVEVTKPVPDRGAAPERDDDLMVRGVDCHEASSIRQANTIDVSMHD